MTASRPPTPPPRGSAASTELLRKSLENNHQAYLRTRAVKGASTPTGKWPSPSSDRGIGRSAAGNSNNASASATATPAVKRARSPAEPHAKRQKLSDSRKFDSKAQVPEEKGKLPENSLSVASKTKDTQVKDSALEDEGSAATGVGKDNPHNFPSRPKSNRSLIDERPDSSQPPIKEPRLPKAYTLDAPKNAPHLPGGATADFWPWRAHGGEPEDTLDEQTIKTGNQDRSGSAHSESGSARPLIWAFIKHKSGLPILTSGSVQLFEQRRAKSAVTAKSTFKPPPRVTLTDNKREAWLRDLADPDIALRRLSRTIPHGVRGKILLEQCLAKKIPTRRAVWLAKCVGANEIRAFKRKGCGGSSSGGGGGSSIPVVGENKWIQDWTSCLQQFVEGLTEGRGTVPDWRDNLEYGFNLLAAMYKDYLVDKEMFIEWALAILHDADGSEVVIWMDFIKQFTVDIYQRRRWGRRLATSLCHQLQKNAANEELVEVLWTFTKTFLVFQPDCFIMPLEWSRYASTLKDLVKGELGVIESQARCVFARNEQIAKGTQQPLSTTQHTSRHKLISILDRASEEPDFAKLSNSCFEAVTNHDLLVTTAIEWGTTPFRTFAPRTYLALRLLRHWLGRGVNVEKPLMALLSSGLAIGKLDADRLYKLISGLIRSGHFSIGKYLQWIIATGCLTSPERYDIAQNFKVRMLENVPLAGLEEPLHNLRAIILKQKFPQEFNPEEYFLSMRVSKRYCAERVPCLRAPGESLVIIESEFTLTGLTGSVKLDLAKWLRERVLGLVSYTGHSDYIPSAFLNEYTMSLFTLQDINGMTNIFEELDDFSILADIFRIIIHCTHFWFLGVIAEAIMSHFETFDAMGAATDLFHALLRRTVEVPYRGADERPIFAAFQELARRFKQDLKNTIEDLGRLVAACEPVSAMAASSPVSDQMAEALQNAGPSFLEEVESLFKSGTSMDRPMLSRIFGDITKRIERAWVDKDEPLLAFIDMLVRLRSFDSEAFDGLIIGWMGQVIVSRTRPELKIVLLPLICAGAVRFEDVLARTVSQVKKSSSFDALAIEFLDLITFSQPPFATSKVPRIYRFEVFKKHVLQHSQNLVMFLVRKVVALCSSPEQEKRTQAAQIIGNRRFPELLLGTFAGSSSGPTPEVKALLGALGPDGPAVQSLDSTLGLPTENTSPVDTLRFLLHKADDFNVILCRFRLATLLSDSKGSESEDTTAQDLITVLVSEAGSTFMERIGTWQGLLSELAEGDASKFHARAVTAMLSFLPDLDTDLKLCHPDNTASATTKVVHNLCAAIEHIGASITVEASPSTLGEIAAKIHALHTKTSELKSLVDLSLTFARTDVRAQLPKHFLSRARFWLATLLHFISGQQKFLYHPKCSQKALAQLAIPLCMLQANPNLYRYASSNLPPLLCDTIALIADALSPQARENVCIILDKHCHIVNEDLGFLVGLGQQDDPEELDLLVPETTANNAMGPPSGSGSPTGAVAGIQGPVQVKPYNVNRWEMLQDASPMVGENDSPLSLSLFGAKKVII